MTRTKLTPKQRTIKQRIEDVLFRPNGFRHIPKNWDKKLWSKPTAQIYDYLEDVFATTLNDIEYYSSMVMLYRHKQNESLLIDFHDSPQWVEADATYNDTSIRYNHTTQKSTPNIRRSTGACDDINDYNTDFNPQVLDSTTQLQEI